LRRSHNAWQKGIQTLKGSLLVTSYAYRCSNARCQDNNRSGAAYKSAEAELLSLKHRTYGIDVIVEIGYLRHKEKRSIPEILSLLKRRQIEIAERECYELLHVFEELIATRPAMLDPDFYDAVIKNGGIILAIDGLQPEKGNSTLYVLQDVLTEKVLYADYLENSSSDNIVQLLDAVKRLEIPVLAVVSDHQHSIRLAVAKVFPGVPHQFCHFHVLRNACLPIIDMDRNLKKEVRKSIRGVSSVEKSLKSKNAAEVDDSHLVDFACLLLRSILVHPGTVPLNWGGITVFQRLRALDKKLQRMLSSRKSDVELARLARITSRWKDLLTRYRKVSRLAGYARELSAILASQDKEEVVEARLQAFLKEVKERSGKRGGRDVTVFRNMAKILESHWGGLFHCYCDKRIPRTNNGLEVTIRRVKMSYRRMTGRRSWDDYIASYGRSVFMLPPDVSKVTLVEWAERADRIAFEQRWKELRARRSRSTIVHRAGTDFRGALRDLEKEWRRETGK
jgi:hypothetical protein